MVRTVLALSAGAWLAVFAQQPVTGPESFSVRTVASGLENPWEIRFGPDGWIWTTERTGKRVTRVHPGGGSMRVVLSLPEAVQAHAQDGVLGLAFGPGFLNGGPDYVYVALTYDADPGDAVVRRLVVRRYTYDRAQEVLTSPVDVISNLPAGADHVGGRLAMGPGGRLYLTIGDQGFNQLSLFCEPIRAQHLPTAADVDAGNWQSYEGKVLRIEVDGSIPADNPVLGGVRSHIYSYGHRNPQGLAFGRDGALYSSEHGPSMDDELNRIEGGGNYGWPYVAGYRDDRAYIYARWAESSPTPCASLTFDSIVAPSGVPQQPESAWEASDFVPPLRTFFTVDGGYNFDASGNATIAPSGIAVYAPPSDGIPGWSDSVLITSLIRGVVYRVKLSADGRSAPGETMTYFEADTRYRDLAISPDGRTIYAATDTRSQQYPGSIRAYTVE